MRTKVQMRGTADGGKSCLQPCQTYAWLVGPWSNCPDGCGVNHSRTVEVYVSMKHETHCCFRKMRMNNLHKQEISSTGTKVMCQYLLGSCLFLFLTSERVHVAFQCVDGWGETVELYNCDTGRKPAATMPCLRPDVICDNCMQNNCSGHGHCAVVHASSPCFLWKFFDNLEAMDRIDCTLVNHHQRERKNP